MISSHSQLPCKHPTYFLGLLVAVMVLAACVSASGQATTAVGSIQGTITDPTGAVIANASIAITNKATGQSIGLTSSSTGTYNSGPLLPGEYSLRVESPRFKAAQLQVKVQVGVISPANVQLTLGPELETVMVQSSPVAVNTTQATIQDVMTTPQIDNLPIGGRNFLDLAQLSPGVQIQDAGNFMPTKEGFSSLSFGGRFGQAARILVDGIDISDETFGTTTQNIPANGIQEFQVSQSSLDLSTELTSSGAVNVVTRSGSNIFHGELLALARFHNTAARIGPKDQFFRRVQYGARFGGYLINNKLFFSTSWERPKQDLSAPVVLAPPFSALSGSLSLPFREQSAMGRLDWDIKKNWRAFYRFSYHKLNLTTSVPNAYQPFVNRTITPVHAAGTDFLTGNFSHSVRFGYTRHREDLADGVPGGNVLNPAPGIAIAIGTSPVCAPGPGNLFCSGPSFIAPQLARQRNLQAKYDGSVVFHSHIIRYGMGVNRIRSVVAAKLLGAAPQVLGLFAPFTQAMAAAGPFPGGDTNPLNYPVTVVVMGNQIGYFTERPEFGFPGGGVYDTRLSWYVGDTWKARPNLSLAFGLRYVHDTGRTDSDLPPIPVLDELRPGLGARVNQPNKNFAPQFGIAWDPWNSGKTSIRAGIGLYYENTLHSNVVFDRAARLEKGVLQGTAAFCPAPVLRLPSGQPLDVSNICFAPIGLVANQIAAIQKMIHDETVAAGPQANPNFVGTIRANNGNLFAPNFRTPYSVQLNAGIQREIRPGTTVSVDYLRNVGLHFLLAHDLNHVGDSAFLNETAALNAIAKTNLAFGCAGDPSGVDCAIARGATIVNYATNGLDSASTVFGGMPSALFGVPPEFGAAFPGSNPAFGIMRTLSPIGRSVYNGLQVLLLQNLKEPFQGVRQANVQVSYSLSRFVSQTINQDYTGSAIDSRNPLRFTGPVPMDRTHQISVGAFLEFAKGLRASVISHVKTALPSTLTLPVSGAPGEIFRTDFTGDGSTGDVLPGTHVGSFGRDVKVDHLNQVIASYNSNYAGNLAPAGLALVDAGLFTQSQLAALGAVMPTVQQASANQVGLDSLLTFDFKLGWAYHPTKRMERLMIEPSVAVYNIFNFANYDAASAVMSGVLSGAPGTANGTTPALRTNRTTFGSGTFAFGAPRVFEWGLKVYF